MLVHVANWYEADRRSATAGAALPMGGVCVATGDANNNRVLNVAASDADLAKTGQVSIVIKVSSDPLQVDKSTVPSEMGNRIVTIKSGDAVVECRAGSIIEYAPEALDASLDPARGGTAPVVGQKLGVKAGLPCSLAASGALIAAPILEVYNLVGGKVRVELLNK